MAIHRLDWHEAPPPMARSGAIAIGNFDGVHHGHASLITALCNQARTVGGPAVAVTFDPHPLQLLRPDKFMPLLTAIDDRAELLVTVGADHVVILKTTQELLALSPEGFFAGVVRQRFGAQAIVEGPNFAFGYKRAGTVETLATLCRRDGVRLQLVPPLLAGSAPVSSSRVRAELVRGNVAGAADLLGRPYRLRGVVVLGQRRGATLGFPTANLDGITTVVPGEGVYAVRALLDGTTWPAAANVGPNPTFGETARKLEVHLIGFHGDLYGRTLAVDFLARLRDTRKFTGPDELREQLRRDVEQARLACG